MFVRMCVSAISVFFIPPTKDPTADVFLNRMLRQLGTVPILACGVAGALWAVDNVGAFRPVSGRSMQVSTVHSLFLFFYIFFG